MNIRDAVSIGEACRVLGTYDPIVVGFAAEAGVQIERRGRARYISRKDLETKIRPRVQEWKNRPRRAKLARATA